MIIADKFEPLTELTDGTVITLYNSARDLYIDNGDFPITKVSRTKSVPELYYVNSGNKYKVCCIRSEIEKYVS